jgi:hypothetical protein
MLYVSSGKGEEGRRGRIREARPMQGTLAWGIMEMN